MWAGLSQFESSRCVTAFPKTETMLEALTSLVRFDLLSLRVGVVPTPLLLGPDPTRSPGPSDAEDETDLMHGSHLARQGARRCVCAQLAGALSYHGDLTKR